MNQAIADQVFDIVASHGEIDRATLTAQSTLKELGVDSLEAIETIFDIEEHFDISFPSQDPNLDGGTLGGLVEAVEQALAAKSGAAAAT